MSNAGITINEKQIQQFFIYSLMTIKEEEKNTKKYKFLNYVEFLEMFCRVALACIPMKETIEFKVHKLLRIL